MSTTNPTYLRLYKYMSLESFHETLRLQGLRATFAQQSVNLMEFMPAGAINHNPDTKKELRSHALISFCRKAESPALWGLYANKGRDICLVFSFPIEYCESENTKVETAEKSEITGKTGKTEKIVEIKTYTLTNGRILRDVVYDYKRVDEPISRYNLHKLLTHKSPSWELEEEVRYAGHVNDFDEIAYFNEPAFPHRDRNKLICKWPMEFLRGALLGPKCELSADFVQRQICQALPHLNGLIKVESTTYDEKLFKIVTKQQNEPNTPPKSEDGATHTDITEHGYKVMYVYFSFDSFCKAMDSWSLKASQSHEVNDPMENMPAKGIEVSDDPQPFFSMTPIISNDAMWGSYADRGRGICLAFCFPTDSEKAPNFVLRDIKDSNPAAKAKFRKINYTEKRPETDDIVEILSHKGLFWSYEKEVRCFTQYEAASHSTDHMLFFRWPMQFLAGAVIGPYCEVTPDFIKQKLRLAYQHYIETNKEALNLPDDCGNSEIFKATAPLQTNFLVEKAQIDESHYRVETTNWVDNKYIKYDSLDKFLNN